MPRAIASETGPVFRRQPADAPCHAPLQLWHEPTQRFSSASQLLIVQRCDNRLNPLVGLLLYAYARANRSTRAIERACVEDVAYRVVAGNLAPDHSTIAEFRCRHERALGEVFTGVLGLCARAGLAWVGVVAIDGTKMSANASVNANTLKKRNSDAKIA